MARIEGVSKSQAGLVVKLAWRVRRHHAAHTVPDSLATALEVVAVVGAAAR